MIAPRFWSVARVPAAGAVPAARLVPGSTVERTGWSDDGQAAADAHAQQRLEEALRRRNAGEAVPLREPRAAYGTPIREEVVAVEGASRVTRNAYGSLCLNTPAMFVADVDAEPAVAARGWLGRLAEELGLLRPRHLGGVAPPPEAALDAQQATLLGRLEGLRREGGGDFRLFRTAAGFRVLRVDRPLRVGEDDAEVFAAFNALGADPAYARICRLQRCFRARLTAKPWRVGVPAPPRHWMVPPVPASDAAARAAWVSRHEAASAGTAACRFVAAVGGGAVHPELALPLALHDGLSGAREGLPLA